MSPSLVSVSPRVLRFRQLSSFPFILPEPTIYNKAVSTPVEIERVLEGSICGNGASWDPSFSPFRSPGNAGMPHRPHLFAMDQMKRAKESGLFLKVVVTIFISCGLCLIRHSSSAVNEKTPMFRTR